MSSQESGVAVASWNVLGRAPGRPGRQLRRRRSGRAPRRRLTRSRDRSPGGPCASGSGPRPVHSRFPGRCPTQQRSGTPTVRLGDPSSRRPVRARRWSAASPAACRPAAGLPTRDAPARVDRSRLHRRGPPATDSRTPRPVLARTNRQSRGTSRARRRAPSPWCRRPGVASLRSLVAPDGRVRGRIVRRPRVPRRLVPPRGGPSAREPTARTLGPPVRARLRTCRDNRCDPPCSVAAGHAPPRHRPRWPDPRRVTTYVRPRWRRMPPGRDR